MHCPEIIVAASSLWAKKILGSVTSFANSSIRLPGCCVQSSFFRGRHLHALKMFTCQTEKALVVGKHAQKPRWQLDELLSEDEWSTVQPIARLNEMLLQHCRGKQDGPTGTELPHVGTCRGHGAREGHGSPGPADRPF